MNIDLIIAIVFFLIGLIPAYYFYKKSIRIKEPVYSIKSVNVISDYSSVFPGLKVAYLDERMENFTVSKVLFFNAGAVTLNRDDIATRNHLRVVANPGRILDSALLAVNNPSSEFALNLDRADNCIVIDFEYLNQDDGAVMLITHTGLSSEDLQIAGDVKEVKG